MSCLTAGSKEGSLGLHRKSKATSGGIGERAGKACQSGGKEGACQSGARRGQTMGHMGNMSQSNESDCCQELLL